MLRLVPSLFLISMVSTALAARPEAPESERPRSLVLDATVVLGSDVVNEAGEKIDSTRDLLVNTESGKIHAVILASGSVFPWGSLLWNPSEKRFQCDSGSAQPASPDASSRDSKLRKRTSTAQAAELDGQCFLVSKIKKLNLIGARENDKGERKHSKLASANGVFIDVSKGYVSFITVSFGGVLGIGADSKVVPWHAVALARDENQDYQLRAHFGDNRLKTAPNFGDGRNQLHNPEYRSTLYSYYGIDKPKYDRAFKGDGDVFYMTLASVLGTDVKSASSEESRGDGVKDLLIDPMSGKAALVLLESGNTTPFVGLKWREEEDCFVMSRRTEKSGDRIDTGNLIAASSLLDADLKSGSETLGSVEDIYIDLASNKLAYVTLSVGTTLGLGGDVVPIPWEVVRVSRIDGKGQLAFLSFSKKQFEMAPKLDGKTGADIHNPAFRERVRLFYVIEGK